MGGDKLSVDNWSPPAISAYVVIFQERILLIFT